MTNTTTKMTYVAALTAVIDGKPITDEILDKLVALRASCEKRAGAEKKPTAKQTANADVRAALVEYINTTPSVQDMGFSSADLIACCPAVAGKSIQYVSAILRQAVLAKEISKRTDKRRSYFIPYDPSIQIED